MGYHKQEDLDDLWAKARRGEFPPWAPCTSRRQPAVAKLAPEEVSKTKAGINELRKGLNKKEG